MALWIFHSNCLWTFIASKLYCVKEGISGYGFNRNLCEIINLIILYYLRMAREWDGEIPPDGYCRLEKWKMMWKQETG